jgi:hypothetical protein
LFAEPLYVSLRNLEAAGMLEPTAWPQWPMPQRRGLLYANFGVVFASPIPVPPTTPVGIFWKGDEIPGVALRLKDPIAALDALEARGVLIDDDLPTRIEKHR